MFNLAGGENNSMERTGMTMRGVKILNMVSTPKGAIRL